MSVASPALPRQGTERAVTAAGVAMHYLDAGAGDGLVLIHGSLCDYRYWRWQMQAFAEHLHVVAPSLPGCWPAALDATTAHADSARPTPIFSIAQHVQSVLALCDQISPDRPVHLLGHSRGAQVALEAAMLRPERVARLVLADPGFAFAGESEMPPVHAQIARQLGGEPLDEVLGRFVDTVNGAGTWRQTVSWFKEMVRANAWTLLPQLRDFERHIELSGLAQRVKCPLLLVGGEFSPARYGARIETLLQALPQARRVVVPKAAHGMNLANARRFNADVIDFLKQ